MESTNRDGVAEQDAVVGYVDDGGGDAPAFAPSHAGGRSYRRRLAVDGEKVPASPVDQVLQRLVAWGSVVRSRTICLCPHDVSVVDVEPLDGCGAVRCCAVFRGEFSAIEIDSEDVIRSFFHADVLALRRAFLGLSASLVPSDLGIFGDRPIELRSAENWR